METSEFSRDQPLQSASLKSNTVPTKFEDASAFLKEINPSYQSKSKLLYDSVEGVQPLTGLLDAEEVEDAFRIAYVDFQKDFMDELKDLFISKLEIELSKIKAEIAEIKHHQARQSVSSNLLDSLKKENVFLKNENEKLKSVFEKLKDSEKPTTNRQLFIDNFQSSRKTSQTDLMAAKDEFKVESDIFSKNEITNKKSDLIDQHELFSETSRISSSAPQDQTPSPRRWADICDSSSSLTKGWAIAAGSVVAKTPSFERATTKKDSLNLVVTGDIPSGSLASIKTELVSRFNATLHPAFRGLERDFCANDISHILVDGKSLIIRLSSLEAKSVIYENKKLLAGKPHLSEEETETSSPNPNTLPMWKMYVSPHLDPQDLKNQKVVLRAFNSLQLKGNAPDSPSFKVFPQGFSIKIVTPNGKKFFYPFDCNQSPKQFLLSKGVRCKE